MNITVFKNKILTLSNWQVIQCDNSYNYIHSKIFEFASEQRQINLIDCGSRFNPYILAKAARYSRINIEKMLSCINISRMFTVYQLKSQLEIEKNSCINPIIISDIDRIIDDDSISENEMEKVLDICILKILEIKSPVLIGTRKRDSDNYQIFTSLNKNSDLKLPGGFYG